MWYVFERSGLTRQRPAREAQSIAGGARAIRREGWREGGRERGRGGGRDGGKGRTERGREVWGDGYYLLSFKWTDKTLLADGTAVTY